MKVVFYLTIFFFLACFVKADDSAKTKQKINFARIQKVGDVLKCNIQAKSKVSALTVYLNKNEPEKEQYENSIKLYGELTAISVADNGNADKIEFKVDSVECILKNELFSPGWKGKTIIVDLTVGPVCEFRIKGEEKPLSKKEIMLLSLVFRPVQDKNMAAFLGTDKPVGVGDSWNAPKEPLMGLIQKYEKEGVKLSPEVIEGKVTVKSHKQFNGIDCWEIEEQLSINGIKDFAFGFIVNILLPVDNTTSTVKLFRKGIEKIEKRPKSNHPMLAGIEKIIVTLVDEMNAEMIPIKNIE